MVKEILIADSDKTDQKEFQRIFQRTDYDVIFSESGEHALRRVKLFRPDLIIAGLSLKAKNGLEVCKVIKNDPECRHIPCILYSNIFQEISEEERRGALADGIISKPLDAGEVLNLVDRLVEEGKMKARNDGMSGKKEWKSLADLDRDIPPKEEELLLEEMIELADEELIELVDVVEESESKMSIHDFVGPQKEEPLSGITPLESWEKLMEEEPPSGKKSRFGHEEKDLQTKGLSLQLDEEITLREDAPEKELFDKIELEEILRKVEILRPTLEKELPPEEKPMPPEAVALPSYEEALEEPAEKYAGLAEFEAALKTGLGMESFRQEARSLPPEKEEEKEKEEEEEEEKAPAELGPIEIPLEEELKEAEEEAFPESLLEELGEEEIGLIQQVEEEKAEAIPKGTEGFEIFEEAEAVEIPLEPAREEAKFQKIPAERMEVFRAIEVPKEITPQVAAAERRMEDLISRGVREMMEGLITKMVPDLTENILNLTIERIERMVKEIVPELAEKLIQEEIKKLQTGEKE